MLSWENEASTICAIISSALSACGASFILLRYWRSRRSNRGEVDASNELIHVLAWLDLITAIAHGLSGIPPSTYNEAAGEPVTAVCKAQGFTIMFGNLALVAWNFFIAHNLFRWVCYGDDQVTQHRRLRWYLVATVAFAGVIATAALLDNAYGDASIWCWISVPGDKHKDAMWKYCGLYLWSFLGITIMVVQLLRIKQNVDERVQGVMSEEAKNAFRSIVRHQSFFILAFVGCWAPGLIHRTVAELAHRSEIFPLNMFQAFALPLQGFINAMVYGNFHVWVCRRLRSRRDTFTVYEAETSNFAKLRDIQERENKNFTTSTLFFTTVDMMWAPFPASLDSWITPGKDIYVFTLLNCTGVRETEECLGRHLLRLNQPMGFRSIMSIAAGRPRGETQDAEVCQIVFVNNADMSSENFQYQPSDSRLWRHGKPAHPAVGISARFYDASLAFLSCALPPNDKASRAPNGPQSVVALAEAEALDLSLDRVHHAFISGQLQHSVDTVVHSQNEVRTSVRIVRTWVNEQVATSALRPAVCALFELDVDRLFSSLV